MYPFFRRFDRMKDSLDPITQFSFDRQPQIENMCKYALWNSQRFTVHEILRYRYLKALCEIGEPPLPTSEEWASEEGYREAMAEAAMSLARIGPSDMELYDLAESDRFPYVLFKDDSK
jgi:hypothetical protein